ncbi:AAA family ATPase [Arthrobacter antibioticus]|uniref:AAA family ATPase n=1 Tax=Arthrobacter sp. H35-MC1 TaxID=3046203 RepID=UPI0024B953EA|nr:ATP-binding protein [Arthrobacter sp. H35-MC1]MDJ0318516.1 ATP-binding protein [Arthrobacter sp. H35-MC1]
MDATVGKFIADFAALVALAQKESTALLDGGRFLEELNDHLGIPPVQLSVVVEEIPSHRLVDADILLAEMAAADPNSQLLGIANDQRNHLSLSDMIQHAVSYNNFPLSQPDYTNVAVGPVEQRQVVAMGLWLFNYAGSPVAVLQRAANPQFGRQFASLEVLALHPSTAAALLAGVRTGMEKRSVFKGQVISLVGSDYGSSIAGVTFNVRPDLSSAEVILPDGVLNRVEEHTLGIGRAAAALNVHSQHLKRGLLLYGPPGTGKTHTVRYLLSRSEGVTAVLLSGGSLARITEATTMARALAPSIVVLEDCDLIAEDRSFGHGPQPLLFEVLDAMDGLDSDCDVAFVLTTNRVDMLERALVQRPGRVDLAVEIPLPSEHEREALLQLYAHGIGFSPGSLLAAAAQSAGTTASFAKELIRRAVVAASLAGEDPADSHLRQAVAQLMADDQALTRNLLGSTELGSHPSSGTRNPTSKEEQS